MAKIQGWTVLLGEVGQNMMDVVSTSYVSCEKLGERLLLVLDCRASGSHVIVSELFK